MHTFGCCVQGKMMSCGVALERLQINETDAQSTSTTLKDKYDDVCEPATTQQICEVNEVSDLKATYTDYEKDTRKTHRKQGQKVRQGVCGMDYAYDGDSSTLHTANLRLTLKKVKVETSDKEEDSCLYVCQSKKLNTSKKLYTKSADVSTNKNTEKSTKDTDGLTDSGKVIY